MYHDAEQQKIIELHGSTALVLAGPGCGKTHILARRVFHASTHGETDYTRMLCVTFTNRAAREMKDRIQAYTGCMPVGLFVGNMHRFCLSFLYNNGILDADTSVLDEEDQIDFLSTILDNPAPGNIKDFLLKAACLYQQEHDHPEFIVRRPVSPFSESDYKAIDRYRQFKKENRLVDFDDILLITYTVLQQQPGAEFLMTGYRWVQVDEVQDMTPLQLAIIDAVTMRYRRTLVYFGDEQQAIFRFIGAGGRALDMLKHNCRGNILRLNRNYRSPGYLVAMCNTLAMDWLGIDAKFLPEAVENTADAGNMILYDAGRDLLPYVAADICRKWLAEYLGESVAVLVRTNREADEVSDLFCSLAIDHFKVSKQDLFHQVPFKTVWSHLAAISMPTLRHPWARLIYQMRCITTMTGARNFVRMLRDCAIGCDELFDFDSPLRIERLVDAYDSGRDIVVFDTETSGLDTDTDDIVQIAAVRIRGGRVVDRFEVFVDTDKRLPRLLAGGIVNPLVEVYDRAEKWTPQQAFEAFIDFIDDAVLAGHNIGFDLAVLRSNIARRTDLNITDPGLDRTDNIDTLTLARQLFPRYRSHRLADLIGQLGIDGVNSHNAADDVMATVSLLDRLVEKARKIRPRAALTRDNAKVRRVAAKLTKKYGDFYAESRRSMDSEGNICSAIRHADAFMKANGFTVGIPRLDYALSLFDSCLIDQDSGKTLRAQLARHLFDLLAFNESDLFANGIVDERLSVMTIHKAKGLEMDNVLVFNVGRESADAKDYARLLYVAFSRARKRLAVGVDTYMPAPVAGIRHFFSLMSQARVKAAVESELANLRINRTN